MPQDTNCRVLVNDQCLYQPGAGVATYLSNVLRRWPADAVCQPAGLITHRVDRRAPWPEEVPGAEGELRLRPLRDLKPPLEPTRWIPGFVRNVVRRRRFEAMVSEATEGGYAACFEANHVAGDYGVPTVTTIHDLSVLEHPEWHPRERVEHWETNFPTTLATTSRWIAISEFTRDRMVAVLGLDPARISVIHNGTRDLWAPTPRALSEARTRLGLPENYLLHLGTLEPRKNLPILLHAWSTLPREFRERTKLVFVGGLGWGGPSFWSELTAHPVSDEVLCTGFVSDAHVAVLLAGARGVLIASGYEGFGLPILEAMSRDKPVICSRIPAFEEVAAGAAEVVDKHDVAGWANAIRRVVEDTEWAGQLATRGRLRGEQFTWERSARGVAAVFDSLVPAEVH
jgi:alpha-1,3-rhamnosyl/mannosyltransferase